MLLRFIKLNFQTLDFEIWKMNLSNRSFGAYLAFSGFTILLVGILLCWLSTGATQNSYSALSGASVELLAGAFVAVVGAVFLLIGLLSATHRRTKYYY